MPDVKSTIATLCDVLNYFCDFKMKPLFFKLAKYNCNEDNAVHAFWCLLNNFSKLNFCDNVIQNVKIYLAGCNYRNLEFYSLPEDMSYGSRELLIAFSWLLGKNNILEHAIQNKILNSKLSQEFQTSNFEKLCTGKNDISFATVEEYQNYILLLCGKINLNIKAISERNTKVMQLLEKVHNLTKDLSVAETNHLKNKRKLHYFLQDIQTISDLLEAYSKWKLKQKCFWDWMITVIDKKETSENICMDKNNLIGFFKYLRTHVKKMLKDDEQKSVNFVVDQPKFPRCVLVSKSSKSFDTNLSDIEINLSILKTEEKDNLKFIFDYLDKIL